MQVAEEQVAEEQVAEKQVAEVCAKRTIAGSSAR
jgi:hypothetical protein